MTSGKQIRRWVAGAILATLAYAMGATAQPNTPLQLLQQLDEFPHANRVDFEQREVLDYELGLGAMQKRRGTWQFKHSERFSGELTRYTWQIIDGFTSIEVMQELEAGLGELDGTELLFDCDGRDCGNAVQWANRVFRQPLLYGREDLQRYRVYGSGDTPRNLLVIYAAARTADRQYLHMELLEVAP